MIALLAVAAGLWYMSQTPPPEPTPVSSGPTIDRDAIRKEQQGKLDAVTIPPPPPPVEEVVDPKQPIPVKQPGIAVPPPNVPANVPPSAVSQQASTAADFVEAGDAAARAGKWSDAVAAYSMAAKKEPRNASIKTKLGLAQNNAGDTSAAQSTLEAAAALGAKGEVYKVLGNIYLANGDVAGARDWYQKYLQGNPKDAAAIQQKLKEM